MSAEPLNLAHLSTFLAVVEHGGFTRAARALHLSQSTVSQHVRALEDRLGSALFNRSSTPNTLTAVGETVVRDARQLLDVHDRLVHRFAAPSAPVIAIGSTEHAADHLLPRLIDVLRATYPDHEVSFTIDRSTALLSGVAQGELDLALTLATGSGAPGQLLGELELCWMTGTAHASVPAPGSTPLSLVAFDNPCGIRERALDLLRGARIESRVAAQASTLDGVLSLARSGLGVALLPIAAEVPDGLHVVDGLPSAGSVAMHLVVREGFDPHAVRIAQHAVVDLLGALA